MKPENYWALQIDDFDLADFDDPIKLLESLKKKAVAIRNEKYDDFDDTLVSLFMDELLNMKISYSYKPVFLLALLEKSNVQGEALLLDIVDFFISFYTSRKTNGFIVEKDDSTFAKGVIDRIAAKKTIVTYPVAVFKKKKFISFDKTYGIIRISPSMRIILTQDYRNLIMKYCIRTIEQYYCMLMKNVE